MPVKRPELLALNFKLVVVESPLAPANGMSLEDHQEYAREAMRDCFRRREAPIASHLLYPQIFQDAKPEERAAGMAAGFAWNRKADRVAVYTDLGVSSGMKAGIEWAKAWGIPVDYRVLYP